MGAMTADDLRAAHRRIFNRDTLQVAVVGDITAAELGPAAGRGLRRPARPPPRSSRAAAGQARGGPASSRSSRATCRRASSSSGTRASCATIRISSPPIVMSEILGGGGLTSRLSEEIREKRGLTYGVSFGLSPMERTGLYAGMLQTRNESAGEALDARPRGAGENGRGRPHPAGTRRGQDLSHRLLRPALLLAMPPSPASCSACSSRTSASTMCEKRNALVEAVTLDQVKAQAKRLLHPDRLIVTVVGQARKGSGSECLRLHAALRRCR